MNKNLTCPVRGCFAHVKFESNPETGRLVGVTGCSLLGKELDCPQECVRRLNERSELQRRESQFSGSQRSQPQCDD